MNLASVFHISLYSMTALAAAMLAYSEGTPFPAGLTIVLSAVALYVHERRRRWRLPTLATNLLGLAALAAAWIEFSGKAEDARLLAGAHVLVYFTCIVLFQAKEMRHYWWLCALSLLQVALGPLLTLSLGWYGCLLLIYLLLAIWTLSVFTLYHGAVEFGAISGGGDALQKGWPAGPVDRGQLDRDGGDRGPAPIDSLATFRQSFARDRRSTVRNAIQQDAPGRWIVPRFVAVVLGLSLVGLALGLATFLFVPRVWIGSGLQSQNSSGRGGQSAIGFSDQVRLGQLGQILESKQRVMVVGLFDNDSDEPLDIDEFAEQQGCPGPLFRGSALHSYETGRWSTDSRGSRTRTIQYGPRRDGMVRQEYTLEMRGSDVLFAIAPFEMAALKPKETVTVDLDTRVLTSQAEARDPFLYRVYSAPRTSRTDAGAEARQAARQGGAANLEATLQLCRQLPDAGLERLTELARDLTRSETPMGDGDDHREQRLARTLERHLRDSGRYGYSLNMAITDDTIDPVEDFLFNRRRGHCEYFASALALMLRAVEIPSRLITGFKGADPLADKGNYEVQQRHAHAWVEAYVEEHWITLDPTPSERDDHVRESSAPAGFWATTRNSISAIWSNYVIALSLDRQQQALYDPLRGSVSTGWGAVRQVLQGAAAAVENVKDKLSSPEDLLTPQGAVLSLLFIAAVVASVRLGRRLWNRERFPAGRRAHPGWIRRILDWLATHVAGRPPDPARIVVAFYEQFQMLVSHAGLTPRNDQTQREFARQVEETLGSRLVAAGLQRFPGELAELFYRVRFGDGTLEPPETAEVERCLGRLKAALLPKRSAVSPT